MRTTPKKNGISAKKLLKHPYIYAALRAEGLDLYVDYSRASGWELHDTRKENAVMVRSKRASKVLKAFEAEALRRLEGG